MDGRGGIGGKKEEARKIREGRVGEKCKGEEGQGMKFRGGSEGHEGEGRMGRGGKVEVRGDYREGRKSRE